MATGAVTLYTSATGLLNRDALMSCFNEASYAELFFPSCTLEQQFAPANFTATLDPTTAAGHSANWAGGKVITGTIDTGVLTANPFSLNVALPREWDEGTTVRPTLHFSRVAALGTAPGSATVGWFCTYNLHKVGTAAGALATITSHSVGCGATHSAITEASVKFIARFPVIDTSACKVGDEVKMSFLRDVGSYVGSAAGSIRVHGIGLIYKLHERTLGSDLEMAATGRGSPKTGS